MTAFGGNGDSDGGGDGDGMHGVHSRQLTKEHLTSHGCVFPSHQDAQMRGGGGGFGGRGGGNGDSDGGGDGESDGGGDASDGVDGGDVSGGGDGASDGGGNGASDGGGDGDGVGMHGAHSTQPPKVHLVSHGCELPSHHDAHKAGEGGGGCPSKLAADNTRGVAMLFEAPSRNVTSDEAVRDVAAPSRLNKNVIASPSVLA